MSSMALPDLSGLALRCESIGVGGASDEESGDEGDSLAKILTRHILTRHSRGYKKRVASTREEPRDQAPSSSGGFVVKKRAHWNAPPWRSESVLDFMFENPLDGKFKDTPSVEQLLRDNPGVVRQYNTSYCNYGYSYRKRTVLIGTLTQLSLKPPCPAQACRQFALHGKHSEAVAECDDAQKNSLPPGLVDAMIGGWISRHEGRVERFLLVDVFSGWGSIEKRVAEKKAIGEWQNVFTFANDIVKRPHTQSNFDMSENTPWNPGMLLAFALNALWPENHTLVAEHPRGALGWVQDNGVAVLFHCSTPCKTYSTNALATHRVAGTAYPKTPQAEHDDAMNASLIDYFTRNVLTPYKPHIQTKVESGMKSRK